MVGAPGSARNMQEEQHSRRVYVRAGGHTATLLCKLVNQGAAVCKRTGKGLAVGEALAATESMRGRHAKQQPKPLPRAAY